LPHEEDKHPIVQTEISIESASGFKGKVSIPLGIKLYVQRVNVNTLGYRRCYLEVLNFMSEESALIPSGIGVVTLEYWRWLDMVKLKIVHCSAFSV